MAKTQVASSTRTLPVAARELYERYKNLHIQGVYVGCPYHINTGLHGRSRALVGKGRPEEIEAAAEVWLAKFQMHADGDSERLQRYLMACGLGVDCSGFAAWIMNTITLERLGKPIHGCLVFPGLKRQVISKLRPLENISANLLTGQINSVKVSDINDVRPGDLIRLINGGHVMIISEVGLRKQGGVSYFKYIQSSTGYGSRNGVQEDEVRIIKPSGYLLEQKWKDELLYADLQRSGADARIVRLKALAAL